MWQSLDINWYKRFVQFSALSNLNIPFSLPSLVEYEENVLCAPPFHLWSYKIRFYIKQWISSCVLSDVYFYVPPFYRSCYSGGSLIRACCKKGSGVRKGVNGGAWLCARESVREKERERWMDGWMDGWMDVLLILCHKHNDNSVTELFFIQIHN